MAAAPGDPHSAGVQAAVACRFGAPCSSAAQTCGPSAVQAAACVQAFLAAALKLTRTMLDDARAVLGPSRGDAAGAQLSAAAAEQDAGELVVSLERMMVQLKEVEQRCVDCTPLAALQLLQPAVPSIGEAAHRVAALRAAAGEDAAELLALARIAAARSCAHLACSNVRITGAPAASEGDGCKKCAACRAVRYCSRECQRADWKHGGHSRVCKALAEG